MTLWRLGVVAASKVGGPAGSGYYAGEGTPSNTGIKKIVFANEAVSTIASTLQAGRYAQHGGVFSSTAGYAFGGVASGSYSTQADKLTFSTETNAAFTTMPATQGDSDATSQNSTIGYIIAGKNAGPSGSNIARKLTFSSEAYSNLSTVPSSCHNGSGFESSTAAYITEGVTLAPSDPLNTPRAVVFKFAFSDDSRSTVTNLSNSRGNNARGMTGPTAGYFGGGFTPSGTSTAIDKYVYATDVRSTIPTTDPASGQRRQSFTANNSYADGGAKFVFSTETFATAVSPIGSGSSYQSGS